MENSKTGVDEKPSFRSGGFKYRFITFQSSHCDMLLLLFFNGLIGERQRQRQRHRERQTERDRDRCRETETETEREAEWDRTTRHLPISQMWTLSL